MSDNFSQQNAQSHLRTTEGCNTFARVFNFSGPYEYGKMVYNGCKAQIFSSYVTGNDPKAVKRLAKLEEKDEKNNQTYMSPRIKNEDKLQNHWAQIMKYDPRHFKQYFCHDPTFQQHFVQAIKGEDRKKQGKLVLLMTENSPDMLHQLRILMKDDDQYKLTYLARIIGNKVCRNDFLKFMEKEQDHSEEFNTNRSTYDIDEPITDKQMRVIGPMKPTWTMYVSGNDPQKVERLANLLETKDRKHQEHMTDRSIQEEKELRNHWTEIMKNDPRNVFDDPGLRHHFIQAIKGEDRKRQGELVQLMKENDPEKFHQLKILMKDDPNKFKYLAGVMQNESDLKYFLKFMEKE